MRATLAVLLVAAAATVFAADNDVPLSPTSRAPLPGLANVALATSGAEYLAVYARGAAIYFQRIAADGTPIDHVARRLEDAELAPGFDDWIEVVWSGETYLVFWNEADDTVVAQPIDPGGVVGEKFTVRSGFTLRDAATWQHEVAVLSSAGTNWQLRVLNAFGTPLGIYAVNGMAGVPQIVRLDEGWSVAAPGAASGLTVVNPQSGTTRSIATERRFESIQASTAGGALVTGVDATLGVLTPSGSFVPLTLAGPVERLSLFHAALVSPTPSGWAVFYRSGGNARMAAVRTDGAVVADAPLSGPFPSPGPLLYSGVAAASVTDANHLLLQPAPVGTTLGLESIGVAGTLAYTTGTLAISDAVQQWGRVAYGPGVDLVVWIESGMAGWDIRATRVQDGPLDDEGILVGTTFPASVDAVYDGETFAVVWSDEDGVFTRRLDLNGNLLDGAPILVSTAPAADVSAAGSGDAGLLASWVDGSASTPRPAVALVRSGRVRSTATIGSAATGLQTEIGGSRSAFLAAFAEPPATCRFDPCIVDEKPVAVQLITPFGAPSGGALPITEPMTATVGNPVANDGSWFVPVLQADGARVVSVTKLASVVTGRIATIPGALRSVSGGLAILGDAFRGMLSPDPETLENLWFEPLPLDEGDLAEGVMGASEALLVDTGMRYVLRPLASPAESADIAVVRGGRLVSGSYVFDTVRIEHRGGDDVPALHVAVWPETLQVTSPIDIVDGWMEGPFAPGDAVEIVVRGFPSDAALVAVLPEVRETVAGDNFLVIEKADEPPPPPSKRRRLVGRP